MTLKDIIAKDGVRPRVIDDCVQLVDDEVRKKSGFSGIAIKAAFSLVKAIKPGIIKESVDHLLDGFVVRLEPFYQRAPAKDALETLFKTEQSAVAEALLGFTDDKAKNADNATMKKAYEKLRPSAKEHVQSAVPGLRAAAPEVCMKIYTKRGDSGDTDLFGAGRTGKDSMRVDAYGTVDEANASIGMARAAATNSPLDPILERLQNDLFALGAELASPGAENKVPRVSETDIVRLENEIDAAENELSALKNFILPTGTPQAAALHFARTVVRRAERLVVALTRHETLRPEVVRYLNRLSDHVFVYARFANHQAGVIDTPWLGRSG